MSPSNPIISASWFSLFTALIVVSSGIATAAPPAQSAMEKQAPEAQVKPEKPAVPAKPDDKQVPADKVTPVDSSDDEKAAEKADAAAVALPVSPEPVQVYGWREDVLIDGMKEKLLAKLDTGALVITQENYEHI